MAYRILYHHRIRADDGQAVHVREMIGALRALGHDVHECALVPKATAGDAPRTATRPPGFWQRLRVPRLALEVLEIAYGRTGARRLRAAAWTFAPDFVYERHALHCDAGLRAARALGKPLLLEVNSPMCEEMSRLGALRFPRRAARTERAVLGGATRVLAVSEVLRQRLLAAGADAARTTVIRNGADPGRFGEAARAAGRAHRAAAGVPDAAFVVGFVGYLRAWHRLDAVVDAMAEPGLRHVHLWVVGDGPALAELRARATARGVAERVRAFGAVAGGEVPAFVCAFDAAVIPAINEYASPLKLFDYLAAGVPAVVPDQPNLRELLTDGKDGLLCPPGDPAALAERLRRLARDPAAAVALGAAGRRTLLDRDWTWRGQARRVIAAYEEASR